MNYKKELKKIKRENKGNIKEYVADIILKNMDYYDGTENEKIISWFKDLAQSGCESGTVSELIYYKDTHKLFDKYYEDIEELRYSAMKDFGNEINLIDESDLKNQLAWFGFQETAFGLAYILGIEV